MKARRGYYVTPVTRGTVGDGYDVRLALELHAAERAVGSRHARLARFRALMEESEAASPTRSGTRPTPPSTSSRSTWRAT